MTLPTQSSAGHARGTLMTKTEFAAVFRRNLTALETALAANKPGSKVWAWSAYHLGVAVKDGECQAVSLDRATIVRKPDGRTFKNGAGKPAALVDRADALRAAIEETKGH